MMNVGWRADGRAGFNIIQQSFEIIIYYFFVELVLNRTVPLSYNRNLELPYWLTQHLAFSSAVASVNWQKNNQKKKKLFKEKLDYSKYWGIYHLSVTV